MNNIQRWLVAYVNDNFVPGSVEIEPVGTDRLRITDTSGESMTFTMNIFCDVMDAETQKILAVSDVPHDLDELALRPGAVPTSWQNRE